MIPCISLSNMHPCMNPNEDPDKACKIRIEIHLEKFLNELSWNFKKEKLIDDVING